MGISCNSERIGFVFRLILQYRRRADQRMRVHATQFLVGFDPLPGQRVVHCQTVRSLGLWSGKGRRFDLGFRRRSRYWIVDIIVRLFWCVGALFRPFLASRSRQMLMSVAGRRRQ